MPDPQKPSSENQPPENQPGPAPTTGSPAPAAGSPAAGSPAAATAAGSSRRLTPVRPGPTHRRRARISRLPILIVVVAVIAIGVSAGRQGPAHVAAETQSVGSPTAAPAAALSSSWFCGGATDTAKANEAPGELLITNAGDTTLTAAVTFVGTNGNRRRLNVQIGADHRTAVAETVTGNAPWVGAMVDLDGGSATVEQQITTSVGTATEPCATAGSDAWYFTSGAELINESTEITLVNPYPDPAIANLTFVTNEGVETPTAFQSIDVPADGVASVNLGTHLRRRSRIATSVSVVGAGRLVAWQTTIVSHPPSGTPLLGTKAADAPNADPASPYFGITSTLGAPSTSTSWYWPQGSTAAGLGEQYTIYNPGDRTAQVNLAVSLEQGSAEPFSITVYPEDVVTITASGQARIPSGSTYSVSLASTNGVGVIASRSISAQAPSSTRGSATVLGARAGARQWLVGGGSVTKTTDEYITVSNPTGSPETVTASQVVGGTRTPISGLTVKLAGGAETLWDLGAVSPTPEGAVLVTGTGDVIVGSELVGRHGSTGVSLSMGVPLAG